MRWTSGAVCVVAAVAAVLVQAGAGTAGDSPREYVVLYEENASAAAGKRAVEAAGGEVVRVNKAVGVATVRSTKSDFAKKATASEAIEGTALNRSIGRAPAERRAKEDALERDASASQAGAADAGSGDPLSSLQWDMQAIGATPNGSYSIQQGAHDVRVGILDTGVDGSHPDIAANFNNALSRNFTTDDPVVDGACETDPDGSCTDPANVDEDGHGTHVASTIGSPVNGLGMAGVAPGVQLINLRAGQDSGYFFLQPTVDALTYAGDIGVDVVNMSYYIDPWLYNCANNPADSPEEQAQQRTVVEATQRALDYARARGVTLVSSEGNGHTDLGKPTFDDSSPDYPDGELSPHDRNIDNSCLSMPTEGNGVIGVTATGKSGRKAYYSDYGLEQADVAAPGGDSREYFGTPAYRSPENTILAAYPESVGRATGDIDEAGNSTTPSVVRNCNDGRCAYYQWIQGTSMASPHAAGVAALIVAARGTHDAANGGKTLSPDTVERVLLGTATDMACPEPREFSYPFDTDGTYTALCEGTKERNGFFGEGLINAFEAAKTPSPSPPPPVGPGPGGTPATPAAPRLNTRFDVGRRKTRVTRLSLFAVPQTKVAVTCRGGGCPRGRAGYGVRESRAVNLVRPFKRRALSPGARITIRVVSPGQPRRRFVINIRRGRFPLETQAIG
jgi:subtilisin family serine protease